MSPEATKLLRDRLRAVLSWAVPLAPAKLRIVELRLRGRKSAIPGLMPADCGNFGDLVEVVPIIAGVTAPLDTLISAPRALVCGGVLELLLYPCYDLLRIGVPEVGLAPDMCGYSGRSGELNRARTSSHMENVLGVHVLESLRTALHWLLPEGPELQLPAPIGRTIDVESADGTELTEHQSLLINLLLPVDIHGIRLKKIGKGWTSAQKFFGIPRVVSEGTEATGATTFVKMGKEEELDRERNITQYMTELLGGFCPHVLGYAKHGGLAAMWLSLADLSDGTPVGFADIFAELMSFGSLEAPEAQKLLQRINSAVDFVSESLLSRLHAARSKRSLTFSVADELGLCRDTPWGKSGVETSLHMSTAFLLEKLWRKAPGDGGLASSVRIHMNMLLGEDAAAADMLTFLDGHALQLPNVCSHLLESHAKLAELRDATCHKHQLCFVHGDLHGDNIMVDTNDNHFLIDFGKTGLGHCLEDLTYLESFILCSYIELHDDTDLCAALDLVPILAPREGFVTDSCDEDILEVAATAAGEEGPPASPRVQAAWLVVRRLRAHLRRSMREVAAAAPGDSSEELRHAGLIAALLLLRNSLFFMAARENVKEPRRRRLALAFACAYARSAQAMVGQGEGELAHAL